MRKVFWDNPYQQSLITTVKEVEGNRILLAETIAFSFSGGQESDKAFINEVAVAGSEMEGNLIYYTLEENHGLSVGDQVTMTIDWPRRYRLMRLHFAAELILELVTRALQVEKIGAHIAETKARIDFVFDQNIAVIFEKILTEYNTIIKSDRPIKTGFLDEASQRRFWEIEGFSKVPCGGTHVKSTAEVGFVALKRKNIGASKERIEITLLEEEGSSLRKEGTDSIKEKNQKKFEAVKKLNLPREHYAIAGSGPLGIRSLREINDIDIIVSLDLCDRLAEKYSITDTGEVKKIVVPGEEIEIFWQGSFYKRVGDGTVPTVPAMIARAEMIDGLPFITLDDMLCFKRATNRPKDQEDIKLIEDWQKNKRAK
jgi:Ser-tRNA(Ala) deacylase AlaX